TGGKIKTDLLMKYGRTRYDIESPAAEHESTIRSPSSTLAVRGTDVSLYDQPPFEPVATSYRGNAEFRSAERQLRFGGKTFAQIRADQPSAADTALRASVVDPRSDASRSPADAALIANQTSRGATFGFDEVANIPVIQNG